MGALKLVVAALWAALTVFILVTGSAVDPLIAAGLTALLALHNVSEWWWWREDGREGL